MSKRETFENRTTPTDSHKSERPQAGELQQQSIRLADEDWQALEAMAKAERKNTGSNITASGVARRILRREIKRAGHGAKTGGPIVIS